MDGESKTDFILTVSFFIGVNWRLLFSVDNVHDSSTVVNRWVKFIGDDGGVRALVVGDQFNLTGSGSRNVLGWGDGNGDWAVRSDTNGGTEWSIDDNMTLESGFEFLAQIRNLDGNLVGEFSSEDDLDISLNLDVRRTSLQLSLSDNGEHDWHALFVDQWETEHGWHLHGVVDELDHLLVVDVNTSAENSQSKTGIGFPLFLEISNIDFEKTLDFVTDIEEDGTMSGLVHFTFLQAQKLFEFLDGWVLLTRFLRAAALVELVSDGIGQLADGTGVDGKFNWVDSHSSSSELEVVSEVERSWDDGVTARVPGSLLEISGVEILNVGRLEGVAALQESFLEVLGQAEDSAGLADHVEVSWAEGGGEFSEVLQGGEDEGVDFLGNLRPGGNSKLLPDSDIGLWAVDNHLDGGHTDHWVFALVESNRDEDGENLLFDVIVIDNNASGAVDFVIIIVWGVLSFTGDDDVFEGEDSLGLFNWIVAVIQNSLNDFDNTWVSNVSESGQVDVGPVVSRFVQRFVELLGEVFNIFGGILNFAEFSVKGLVVSALLNTGVDAGLVQKNGVGQDSGGLQLLFLLNSGVLDELEESFPHFWGWVSDVKGESHDELGSLLSSDLSLFDELHDSGDGRVGSSHGHSVQDEVLAGLLFEFVRALLLLNNGVVDIQNLLLVEESEGLGGNGEFGHGLFVSNGSFLIVDIFGGFQNKFDNAFLHFWDGQGGNQHWSQWSLMERGETEVSLLRLVTGSLFGGRRLLLVLLWVAKSLTARESVLLLFLGGVRVAISVFAGGLLHSLGPRCFLVSVNLLALLLFVELVDDVNGVWLTELVVD